MRVQVQQRFYPMFIGFSALIPEHPIANRCRMIHFLAGRRNPIIFVWRKITMAIYSRYSFGRTCLILAFAIISSCLVLDIPTAPTNAKQHYGEPSLIDVQDLPSVIPEHFKPALEDLRRKTRVPIILPSNLPADIHLFVYTATQSEYGISLDLTPDCKGHGACIFGDITGKKVRSRIPVGTTNVPFDRKRVRPVSLRNGIKGYYIDFTCAASCDSSRIFWIKDGYQFMVGIKGGKYEDVIKMANAAIANQK
jgi:hypothetical protein